MIKIPTQKRLRYQQLVREIQDRDSYQPHKRPCFIKKSFGCEVKTHQYLMKNPQLCIVETNTSNETKHKTLHNMKVLGMSGKKKTKLSHFQLLLLKHK